MVYVVRNNRRCLHSSCSKNASFGAEGSRKKEFCAGHAKEGRHVVSQSSGLLRGDKRKAEGSTVSRTVGFSGAGIKRQDGVCLPTQAKTSPGKRYKRASEAAAAAAARGQLLITPRARDDVRA